MRMLDATLVELFSLVDKHVVDSFEAIPTDRMHFFADNNQFVVHNHKTGATNWAYPAMTAWRFRFCFRLRIQKMNSPGVLVVDEVGVLILKVLNCWWKLMSFFALRQARNNHRSDNSDSSYDHYYF